MKELEKLLELGNDYKIEGYNEMKENNKRIKINVHVVVDIQKAFMIN